MKWLKTVGVYYMIFKVPALREEIGDPLDTYSVNHGNSLISHFLERVERRYDSCCRGEGL